MKTTQKFGNKMPAPRKVVAEVESPAEDKGENEKTEIKKSGKKVRGKKLLVMAKRAAQTTANTLLHK